MSYTTDQLERRVVDLYNRCPHGEEYELKMDMDTMKMLAKSGLVIPGHTLLEWRPGNQRYTAEIEVVHGHRFYLALHYIKGSSGLRSSILDPDSVRDNML